MDESKCIRSWCSTAVDHRVCFARYISAYKEERVNASQVLPKPEGFEFTGDKQEFVEKIREALYFSKIMSYAQGFAQLRTASKEYDWQLPFGEIAKIWRAGCIIRAQFLQKSPMLMKKIRISKTYCLMTISRKSQNAINNPFVTS